MALPLSFNKDLAAFLLDVARGAEAGFSIVKKFGHNDTIGATEETVWSAGGLYPYLSSATQFNISSSSISDAPAQTGALTIQIYGLDANYNEINETIILNGQNGVPTVKSYLRIFRAIVRLSGTGDVNAGDIYAGTGAIVAGVPAVIHLMVEAGKGQTLMAIYTIPAGKTAYLVRDSAYDSSSKLMVSILCERPVGMSWNIKSYINLLNAPIERPHELVNVFAEKSDVEMRAIASGAGGAMTCEFDLLLEGN